MYPIQNIKQELITNTKPVLVCLGERIRIRIFYSKHLFWNQVGES